MASATAHDAPEPMHALVTTVAAPACVLGDRDGQIRPRGVQGLYVSDTRVLHGAVLTVGGAEPVGLDWAPEGPYGTAFHAVVTGLGDNSPDPTVRVRRTRTARADGLTETVRVTSTATTPVDTVVELRIAPDLTPLMRTRAGRDGDPIAAAATGGTLAWSRAGVTVTVTAEGAELDPAGATARWRIRLGRGDQAELRWSVGVGDHIRPLVAPAGPAGWTVPAVPGADHRLVRLLDRALDDLASLRMADATAPDQTFIAAGAPWFLTLFGRDSIWAARMTLTLGTDLAASTLRALAARQGTRVDVATGEEPGKIMHELRRDDITGWLMTARGGGPAVYYGTVDATALWISLLADAWRWGMDREAVASLLPTLRSALGWLAVHGDPTGTGFVSYLDRTGRGLANQGWKDSGDSVRFRDGARANPPIALCEVQGYAHRAALDAADLFEAFDPGSPDADAWRGYAGRLAQRFRDRFWVDGPLGAQPALALDRDGRPVDSLTSNIGHLLGTGLLSRAEERSVARLLGTPALAAGYGLRTMSDIDAAFDPMSYHCGAIWPHDTAIALLGLASMGPDPDARATIASLSDGLLAAAEAFEYRLPEMYCGDARGPSGRPLPHPAACRPQAWSAAAAVALAQVTLDLAPDASGRMATAVHRG